MNNILVIVAIVGIGYLLYRSLVIKRQPDDTDATKNSADIQNRQPAESKSPQVTPPPASASSQAEPAESPARTSSPDTVPPQAERVEPTPPAEDPIGAQAEQEVVQAEVKAVEKEIKGEPGASSELPSEPALQVPEQVEVQAKALAETKQPLARHRLYQQIVEQTYRGRGEEAARLALHHYAQAHIAEFDDICEPLKKQNGGKLPQVASFKHYTVALTEAGQYDEAIAICQQALSYDLKDGTKSGYRGRIERIEKLKIKQQS